jgi:hypothetical protein
VLNALGLVCGCEWSMEVHAARVMYMENKRVKTRMMQLLLDCA